jgi:hypothetical protein
MRFFNFFALAANVNNYRHLHWAIVKNAQSLNPVSDFHLYLNSLPESVQFQVVKGLGYETTPFYFLQSSFMSVSTLYIINIDLIFFFQGFVCVGQRFVRDRKFNESFLRTKCGYSERKQLS